MRIKNKKKNPKEENCLISHIRCVLCVYHFIVNIPCIQWVAEQHIQNKKDTFCHISRVLDVISGKMICRSKWYRKDFPFLTVTKNKKKTSNLFILSPEFLEQFLFEFSFYSITNSFSCLLLLLLLVFFSSFFFLFSFSF